MAAINLTSLKRDAPRPDGLCPRCHNPSLMTYTVMKLDLDGVTILGERDACTDDRRFAGPLRPFTESAAQ